VKAKELRKKSTQELLDLLKELRNKLLVLETLRKNGRPFNYGERRNIRRDIARILTILRERENA